MIDGLKTRTFELQSHTLSLCCHLALLVIHGNILTWPIMKEPDREGPRILSVKKPLSKHLFLPQDFMSHGSSSFKGPLPYCKFNTTHFHPSRVARTVSRHDGFRTDSTATGPTTRQRHHEFETSDAWRHRPQPGPGPTVVGGSVLCADFCLKQSLWIQKVFHHISSLFIFSL